MDWVVIIKLIVELAPVIVELLDKDSAEYRLYSQRFESLAEGKPGAGAALLETALTCAASHAAKAKAKAQADPLVPVVPS